VLHNIGTADTDANTIQIMPKYRKVPCGSHFKTKPGFANVISL